MDPRFRIDPAEEARHRKVMDDMGVYDVDWALSKVLEQSDVQSGQNRLLLTKEAVRAGPIPKLFPELEERRADGLSAEHKVSVTVLDEEHREKVVQLRYLNSNKAYRIMGPEWRLFVLETAMAKGDRLDLYTCKRRNDGERCIFFFKSKGCDVSVWFTNGRKRVRQPVRDPVVEDDDEEFFLVKGGRAYGGNGKHRGDVDYTRAKRERRDRGKDRRRSKSGSHAGREDRHMLFVTNGGIHDAWTGGFQGDYGYYKAERRREEKAPWDLNATPDEREAARGLLMLKYAIFAEHC